MLFPLTRNSFPRVPIVLVLFFSIIPMLALGASSEAQARSWVQLTTDQNPDACDVRVGKTASPSNVEVGQPVRVRLTLAADCPDREGGGGPADIVLAIDRSNSQLENGTWQPTVDAAEVFLELIDFDLHQVGLVTFGTDVALDANEADLAQPLTADRATVEASLGSIPPPPEVSLWTNITAAVDLAQEELSGSRHRAEATPILVVLSDGNHSALFAGSPVSAAERAKQAGTLVITIGLGTDASARSTLTAMASRDDLYFPAPTADDLEQALRDVAGAVTIPGQLTNLVITDLLGEDVVLVEGSVEPPPVSSSGGTLVWELPSLPAEGWSATYLVLPQIPGRYSTNKLAYVDFVDSEGEPGSRFFPDPYITVREVGAAIEIFAPIALKGWCKPARPFDVVLLLDSSSSMEGEKLDATREAARAFLGYLDLPPSRAAVVAFNALPNVVEDLSTDREALRAALDRLPAGTGTRIDYALSEAVALLNDPGRDPERGAAIILITDGRHDSEDSSVQEVYNAAAGARRAATVYTIGIGQDVDPQLLTRVAGDPARYHAAPGPQDLLRIYVDIAGALPCGSP